MNNSSSKFNIIYAILHSPDNVLSLNELFQLAKVSMSGYYNWVNSSKKREEREAVDKAIKTNNYADNLVKREFEEHGPRMILLIDILYLPYNGTNAYISTIIDGLLNKCYRTL